MEKTDIRSKIIDGLKAGKRPWVRPWSSDPNCGSPCNVISKKPYRGINPLVLSLASDERPADYLLAFQPSAQPEAVPAI